MMPAVRARSVLFGAAPVLVSAMLAAPALAHQPVMDMAPRWKGGYGFQIRQTHYGSSSLLNGTSEIANPFGLDKSVSTTWLEGIYTFRREVRLTVKIPYIDQSRTGLQGGAPVSASGRGLGDVVIGLPLKRYENRETATSNIAITPSIRLPTGDTDGGFPVGDGSTDFGVSFSASFESAGIYQYYDLWFWENGSGENGIDQGDEIGFDANIGWHPYHDNLTNTGIFLMWDLAARYEGDGRDLFGPTGGQRISTGLAAVYYTGGIMLRGEYRTPVHENVTGTQLSRGDEIGIGIGFVF